MANVVIAPLVIAKDEQNADQYFYRGTELPGYVKGDALKRLVDAKLVKKVSATEAKTEAPAGTTPGEGQGS